MTGPPRRAGHGSAFVVLTLTSTLGACSNSPDALIARGDAGAPGSPEPGDILAMYADLGEDDGACLACLEEECSEEERTCLEDPDCTEQALCKAHCRDPACALHCPAGPLGAGGLADLTLSPDGPVAPDVCRRKRCAGACAVGAALDCPGGYEWNDAPSPFGRMEVVALPPASDQPWSQTTVRFCDGDPATCDSDAVTFEQLADSWGGTATVDTLYASRSSFLELQAPNAYRHLWYPLFDSTVGKPVVLLTLLTRDLVDIAGPVFDDPPGDGFLVLYARDCMLDDARGIQFSVEPAPTHPEARVWYDIGGGGGDRTMQGGLGGVSHVDPGLVEVRAVHADTQEEIARRSVWVTAGALTLVDLAPLSSEQP